MNSLSEPRPVTIDSWLLSQGEDATGAHYTNCRGHPRLIHILGLRFQKLFPTIFENKKQLFKWLSFISGKLIRGGKETNSNIEKGVRWVILGSNLHQVVSEKYNCPILSLFYLALHLDPNMNLSVSCRLGVRQHQLAPSHWPVSPNILHGLAWALKYILIN